MRKLLLVALTGMVLVPLLTVTAAAAPRPSAGATPAARAAEDPPPEPFDIDPMWASGAGSAEVRASTTDFLGNTYVADPGQPIKRYDPNGALSFTYPAAVPESVHVWALAVDQDLSLLVGASLEDLPPSPGDPSPATSSSLYVLRVDRFGQTQWTRRVGPVGPGTIFSVATGAGLVAVTAQHDDTADGRSIVATFEAATGAPRWTQPLIPDPAFTGARGVTPSSVSLGRTGHVVVGGWAHTDATIGTGGTPLSCPAPGGVSKPCAFVLDLEVVAGAVVTLADLGGPDATVRAVAADDAGVAVVGTFSGPFTIATSPPLVLTSVGTTDVFTLSLTPALEPRWARQMSGTGVAHGNAVALDKAHRITVGAEVAGTVTVEAGDGLPAVELEGTSLYQGVLASYDDTGRLAWTAEAHPVGTVASTRLALGADAFGVVRATIPHTASMTVGAGQSSVTLPGAGTALAAFAPQAPMPGSGFTPTPATRVLDSRTGTGGWNGPLVAGAARTLVPVPGALADHVTSVVLNVTVTGSTANSVLTAYPAGVPRPVTSNLNFGVGQTISNLVTVIPGAGGAVELATSFGETQVVVDLVGIYRDALTNVPVANHLHAINPQRVLDSRTATGGWNAPLGPGETRPLTVGGVAGVPATATAVVLSLTGTEGSANTFLRVTKPGDGSAPTSNLNLGAGETASNLVMVELTSAQQIEIFNQLGSVQVVVDVAGYFEGGTGGGLFLPLPSFRSFDTRTEGGLGPFGPNQYRPLAIESPYFALDVGIAISGNITATQGTTGSYLRVQPNDVAGTNASTLLFGPGETVPTMTISGLGHNGTLGIYNQLGTVEVVLDLNGFFALDPAP